MTCLRRTPAGMGFFGLWTRQMEENCLTPPTLLEIEIFRQSSIRTATHLSVPKHTQPSVLAKPFQRTEEQSPSCASADLACRPPHGLHLPAPQHVRQAASRVRESVSAEVFLASSLCTDIRLPLLGGPTHRLLSLFSQRTWSK